MKSLLEFYNPNAVASNSLDNVVSALVPHVGSMQRVGGPTRIYTVGRAYGAVFAVGSGTAGLGFTWSDSSMTNIDRIYFWDKLSVERSPDYEIDLLGSDIHLVAEAVAEMIKKKEIGQVEVNS